MMRIHACISFSIQKVCTCMDSHHHFWTINRPKNWCTVLCKLVVSLQMQNGSVVKLALFQICLITLFPGALILQLTTNLQIPPLCLHLGINPDSICMFFGVSFRGSTLPARVEHNCFSFENTKNREGEGGGGGGTSAGWVPPPPPSIPALSVELPNKGH